MEVEIRRAAFSDIEEMSVVVDSAWRDNYRDIFSPEIIGKFTGKHRRESFAKLLEHKTDILVLAFDGVIAALCSFQQIEAVSDCAEIILMYVHPKYQRHGFGTKLLLFALDEMRRRGYARAVLDTAEKNNSARRFYEKNGFILQKQYENGINYVTYKIEL